eukprot:3879080-Heterocapsa_arctica.AAC.1
MLQAPVLPRQERQEDGCPASSRRSRGPAGRHLSCPISIDLDQVYQRLVWSRRPLVPRSADLRHDPSTHLQLGPARVAPDIAQIPRWAVLRRHVRVCERPVLPLPEGGEGRGSAWRSPPLRCSCLLLRGGGEPGLPRHGVGLLHHHAELDWLRLHRAQPLLETRRDLRGALQGRRQAGHPLHRGPLLRPRCGHR